MFTKFVVLLGNLIDKVSPIFQSSVILAQPGRNIEYRILEGLIGL